MLFLMVFGPAIIAALALVGSIVLFGKARRAAYELDPEATAMARFHRAAAMFLLVVPFGVCACYGYVLNNMGSH